MRYLKQSTSVVVVIGPFVDATDAVTAETALSPAASNVELFKSGGTSAVDISARSWTHIGNGQYRVTLTTSDVDTAGSMLIHAHISGARPVWHEFNVLAETAYDAMISGSALPSNMTQVVGNGTAATLAAFGFLGLKNFTVGSGSTTTRIVTNLTEAQSGHWAGGTVVFISGTLAGQRASISDYNGTTKELTISALTQAPSNGDNAVIV